MLLDPEQSLKDRTNLVKSIGELLDIFPGETNLTDVSCDDNTNQEYT